MCERKKRADEQKKMNFHGAKQNGSVRDFKNKEERTLK